MAVLAVATSKFIIAWPSLFDEVKVFIIPLSELIFDREFILIGNRSQDKCLVAKLLFVAITKELHLEVARVILLLVFVHALVDVRLHLQGLLDSL